MATPIEVSGDVVSVGARLSVVRCPWHKWDFEISTGQCAVDSRLRVRRYPVDLDGDELVISLKGSRASA